MARVHRCTPVHQPMLLRQSKELRRLDVEPDQDLRFERVGFGMKRVDGGRQRQGYSADAQPGNHCKGSHMVCTLSAVTV